MGQETLPSSSNPSLWASCQQTARCQATGQTKAVRHVRMRHADASWTSAAHSSCIVLRLKMCSTCIPGACKLDRHAARTGKASYSLSSLTDARDSAPVSMQNAACCVRHSIVCILVLHTVMKCLLQEFGLICYLAAHKQLLAQGHPTKHILHESAAILV